MISDSMKKYLEDMSKNPIHDPKFCVYMYRIQKRIDRELDMLLWMCQNYPNVFKNKDFNAYGKITRNHSNERTKKLLLVVKALNPNCDVQLVKDMREYVKNES